MLGTYLKSYCFSAMKQDLPYPQPLVLVVEDDPLVRVFGADVLEDAGFAVIEAGDAEEALHILEARSDVRVVFTDIEMPGSLNGLGLAWRIRELWPEIHVLITSGRHVPSLDEMPREDRFVPKPYAPGTLVRHVEECIGGKVGG
jgi:CheY-like chemotaxis protein